MARTTAPLDVDLEALVARTRGLLASHVPLSLLLDLAAGPHSEQLWAEEAHAALRPPAADTLRAGRADAAGRAG